MRCLSSLKPAIVGSVIIGICMLGMPLTSSYAKSGCCSRHGGVAGCNTATGYQLCKDKSSSPSCKCDGTTSTATTTNSTTTTTETAKPKKTKTKTTTAATTTTTAATTTTTATTAKQKGCCAHHGGVSKCDSATGFQVCKDGSHSTTCKC